MNAEAPFTVLGLGSAGVRIVGELSRFQAASALRLLAVDTDQSELAASPLSETQKLLLGGEWYKGLGCGGDVTTGQRAVGNARSALTELLRGSGFLLVVGGLGKGTASGGVGVIQSIARKLELATAYQLTLPFTIEGHSRRRIAEDTLRQELLPVEETVWCIPNDLLFSVLPSTTPLADSFRLSDQENARAALALSAILRCGSLLPVSPADFAALLKRRKSFCSLGTGTGSGAEDGANRCTAALERLLESPLLGGREKITGADAVVISLLGGESLELGEARQALDAAARLVRPETRLLVSAGTTPEFGDTVQLTILTVKFDQVEESEQKLTAPAAAPARTRAPRKPRTTTVDDLIDELPLETFTKGVMERTQPVFYHNEDLDVPTYQRRRVPIDPGGYVEKHVK